jgi:sigma-B regulation protein RsbU (phosphoserine phosphatase)
MTILDLKEKNRQLTLAYEELKNAQAQIIEKEKLEHELEIARQIQQRLLPQEFPVIKNYKIGALMIPARAVGGDFFDFIPISDQLLGIVIGDVSDKGVPAALFMSLTYSLLHAEASRGGTPAEILKRVNHHLMNINSSDMFVTMILGILNLETHELDFARAGHPLPLIINKEYSPLNLKIQMGQPLGILDDPKLDDQQVKLPHGSIVIFFSDGLSETMNQKGDFFGEQRILQIVKESSKTNIQMICDKLWQAVQKFSEDIPQQDDFTIVAIQVS